MYHIGQTGRSIQKGLEYDFEITEILGEEKVNDRVLRLKITSGDKRGKHSIIMESEIDNTLLFNQ